MDKTGRTEMEMYFVKQAKQVKKEKKKKLVTSSRVHAVLCFWVKNFDGRI